MIEKTKFNLNRQNVLDMINELKYKQNEIIDCLNDKEKYVDQQQNDIENDFETLEIGISEEIINIKNKILDYIDSLKKELKDYIEVGNCLEARNKELRNQLKQSKIERDELMNFIKSIPEKLEDQNYHDILWGCKQITNKKLEESKK